MDEKTMAALLIGVVYPIMILIALIGFMFVYAYFLPERGKSTRRGIEHKIRK